MPIDYSNYKTPVFPNINDNPVAPTASKAGNGADLINKVNSLINELEVILNSLDSNSGTALNWLINTPTNPIERVEVYHLNVSESYLYSSQGVSLQFSDHIKTYLADTDFTTGSQIDISEIITSNGVGYYFFLFSPGGNTFKDDSRIDSIETEIKGAARQFDKYLQVAGYNEQNNYAISQRVEPLVVTMPVGNVTITLIDTEEIILG